MQVVLTFSQGMSYQITPAARSQEIHGAVAVLAFDGRMVRADKACGSDADAGRLEGPSGSNQADGSGESAGCVAEGFFAVEMRTSETAA